MEENTKLIMTESKPERADSEWNYEQVRTIVLQFISKHLRKPTVAELMEATGLSVKTAHRHLKRIKFSTDSANPYRALSHDVIMRLFERTKHDTSACKLWFQLFEGFSEKMETKHTGNVGFVFQYIAPEAPETETE